MTLINDEKSEEELSCRFKIDMRNLTNFDPSTRKSQKFAFQWASFEQSICLSYKKYRGVLLDSTEY